MFVMFAVTLKENCGTSEDADVQRLDTVYISGLIMCESSGGRFDSSASFIGSRVSSEPVFVRVYACVVAFWLPLIMRLTALANEISEAPDARVKDLAVLKNMCSLICVGPVVVIFGLFVYMGEDDGDRDTGIDRLFLAGMPAFYALWFAGHILVRLVSNASEESCCSAAFIIGLFVLVFLMGGFSGLGPGEVGPGMNAGQMCNAVTGEGC
jgi:hypothetical protein